MGKPMDPQDWKEFKNQVKAEPQEWTTLVKAFEPKVIIENEIFPRPHEVYNCTSCRRGRELPAHSISKKEREEYTMYCKWDLRTHIGPLWNDIMCKNWDRKIPIPTKGFLPGVEEGQYDRQDRR